MLARRLRTPYDNVEIAGPDGGRSHVERRINEAEAAVVRRTFELASRSVGLRRVCWTLTKSANGLWEARTRS